MINKFKEDFNKKYSSVDDFMDSPYDPQFSAHLVQDNRDDKEDSYEGYSSATLERVYHFPLYNIYIKFQGVDNSYDGEEWTNNFTEVIPQIINKTIYKEI